MKKVLEDFRREKDKERGTERINEVLPTQGIQYPSIFST